jgi:hypothetical protein
MNKFVSALAVLTVGGTVLASGVATAAAAPSAPGSTNAQKPHHVVRSTPSAHGKLSPLASIPAGASAHSNAAKATPNEVFSVQMHNFDSYRALDADTDTIGTNGTKVQLWDDNGGGSSQVWTMTTTDTEGVYKIANSASPRVLDADEDTIRGNGTTVQLWDDLGAGQSNQLWGLLDTGYYDKDTGFELYKWANIQSGRVLDADADGIADNGTRVQLWDDLGVDAFNQDWELTTS